MHYDWRDYFTAAQMGELERAGQVVMPQGEGRARAAVVTSAELLEALADCDQAALFARLRCPVLLIDGDGDDEERQSLANARRGLPLLPPGSRVELLAGLATQPRGPPRRSHRAAGRLVRRAPPGRTAGRRLSGAHGLPRAHSGNVA